MPKKSKAEPKQVVPYSCHGLDFQVNGAETQALADCPWCGGESKFSLKVDGDEGFWRCFACNEGSSKKDNVSHGGNLYTFLRLLHQRSEAETTNLKALADQRKLSESTLRAWGVVEALIQPDEYLIPAYNDSGSLVQLYRYTYCWDNGERRRVVWPTSELRTALFGLQESLFDQNKSTIYLCEGPWDAMALWEILGRLKWTDGPGSELALTSNRDNSLLADANVLAVPGCLSFQERWCGVFTGKNVVLMFDNDHPKERNGQTVGRGGYLGMQKTARVLTGSFNPPTGISYLHWGDEGYDPALSDGYDVRDWLTAKSMTTAQKAAALLEKLTPVPADWLEGVTRGSGCGAYGISTKPCKTWGQLQKTWVDALEMRQTLWDCLSVMLAVCLSTDQVGDQLFLQLIGDAGSAKTKLCEGLLASDRCYPLEKAKGFLSGFKKGQGEEDYSLLARINHKTLITAEGDLMLSSPNFNEIMSEQRRIFDGSTSSSYKNLNEDRRYTGLRTPWIIAGTPAMLNRHEAHLGDRFLRVWIDKPSAKQREDIMLKAALSAAYDTTCISNGQAEKSISPKLLVAQQTTGGYVEYLRANVETLMKHTTIERWALEECMKLATFTAYLRSRPDPSPSSEMICKEEPTRLTKQFVRLAKNLAGVLGKNEVDREVMRIVRKVARDTSRGLTLEICDILYLAGDSGLEGEKTFESRLAQRHDDWKRRLSPTMNFLQKISVWDWHTPKLPVEGGESADGKPRRRMANFMRALYQQVMRNKG